jgi:hypothetical protein
MNDRGLWLPPHAPPILVSNAIISFSLQKLTVGEQQILALAFITVYLRLGDS